MEKVANFLQQLKIRYDVFSENGVTFGLSDDGVFTDITITEDKRLDRICYYAKMKDLYFEKEIMSVVQDMVSEINNTISYGHISLGVIGPNCVALYRCHSSLKDITLDEIHYNIKACNFMVHEYFKSFEHLRV